ncbi:hypothetical protein [Salimicrobium jeotgali]|uniref:hypothetical protein n=1 Tax=Salimicrobium jeotgali TaxID=1230341 RepID=UPI000C8398BA|nr:hypothetical protein [Salimicrobium jeotgali]
MSYKKRLLFAIGMAAFMAVISLLLGFLNNDGINKNHLIGTGVAGVIIGYWLVPSTLKKKSRNSND